MTSLEKLKIKQFRFYENGSSKNAPAVENYNFYCTETSFTQYAPIQQLGIQTLPGTKFYLNQSVDPIIVGGTGIYEIDLRNTTAILGSIRFDQQSMISINNNPNGFLLMDFVYSGEA